MIGLKGKSHDVVVSKLRDMVAQIECAICVLDTGYMDVDEMVVISRLISVADTLAEELDIRTAV